MRVFTKTEEQILLAIYHLEEDAYLISIREQIRKFTGKSYSVGTIYAPLNRLHRYAYLKATTIKDKSLESKKPVKYYSLTKSGFRALAQLKRQNEIMWKGIELTALGGEVD